MHTYLPICMCMHIDMCLHFGSTLAQGKIAISRMGRCGAMLKFVPACARIVCRCVGGSVCHHGFLAACEPIPER